MTSDISLFRKNSDNTPVHELADNYSSGTTVTGVEKLAQRFVVKLMTKKGSVKYQPREGTIFLTTLVNGTASSESDVFAAFYASVLSIVTSMKGEDKATDPNDEKLKKAILSKVSIAPGKIFLDIEIVSKANTKFGMTIPLKLRLGV